MPARPDAGREPVSSAPALRLATTDGDPLPATRADPGQPLGHVRTPVTVLDQESFEVGIPNIARIYDALLGGKDNYAVDREAALALAAAIPSAARAARDNRAFLGRAVRYLAEAGITQFLDIGTGLPTQGAVHEIAQEACPGARVLYVDNDEVVVSHARALLAKAPGVLAVEGKKTTPPHAICGASDTRSQGVAGRLHDLRHTFATRLAEYGVPESTMLATMGHMSRQCWNGTRIFGWPRSVML